MKTKIKTIHSLSRKEKKYNKKLSNKIIRRALYEPVDNK
jgi:hypothetical protein